ncbi:hypothetical protein Ae201684P_014636 [Aphanomyces euteiches]|uniref:Uncharacterized protein n=1 Tax=Aphanomyces euteiches TaxID=100861 RepID=A0A6G0WY37_9STRA|nr:hypothetical protein Ae201684_010526 [Aphanomyces euteiches]KAH9089881.1 hypothetical protein Ae201684P_014636 [Aphanomyces euteiches]
MTVDSGRESKESFQLVMRYPPQLSRRQTSYEIWSVSNLEWLITRHSLYKTVQLCRRSFRQTSGAALSSCRVRIPPSPFFVRLANCLASLQHWMLGSLGSAKPSWNFRCWAPISGSLERLTRHNTAISLSRRAQSIHKNSLDAPAL